MRTEGNRFPTAPGRPAPPSLVEIVLLPPMGVLLAEWLRTRHNEPTLFVIPVFLVLIRLALSSWKRPQSPGGPGRAEFERLAARYVGQDQIAAVFLLILESGAILVLSIPGPDAAAWAFPAATYAVYVSFRMAARSCWIKAYESSPTAL